MRYKENIQAGDLKTPIRIQFKKTIGTGSFADEKWIDLGNELATDPPKYIYSKLQGAFGSRAYIANSVQASRPAEVTIRYRNDVDESCRVIYDGILYDIISPYDLYQNKQWLVFQIKASVSG